MLRDIERYLERCALDEAVARQQKPRIPFGKRRRLTYRDRWYLKHGFKNPRPQKPRPAFALDAAVNLQQHDEQYHNGHYEEGQKCKLRDTLAKGDEADAGLGRSGGSPRPSWVTPEMDAEYAEAFDAFEEAEARGSRIDMGRWRNAMIGLLRDHARQAFSKSVVRDNNGDPKVLYHGTTKGGFTSFDTDGVGKTKDTGAWFVDDARNAKTYSGSSDDVSFPRFTEKYLTDNGFLRKVYAVIDKNGNPVEDSDGETEDAVRANYDLEDGERIAEMYKIDSSWDDTLFLDFGSVQNYVYDHPDDFVDYDVNDQDCIYSVFVNMKDPNEIDAHGDNWDEIMTVSSVCLNGELLDSFYTREEAEKFAENQRAENPDANVEIDSFTQTTDEIVRDAKMSGVGYDGVIIKDVNDEGGEGYGGCLSATDYIVFDGRNIKMADMVTFDDSCNLIPLSKRFDFTKDDVRY